MSHRSVRRGISCPPHDVNCTRIIETLTAWNDSQVNAYKLVELPDATPTGTVMMEAPHAFPTADVPDHAHYIIGSVILLVGITGMLGNFLVIYAFGRSRTLRTPANMFIINLAITDFMMSVTQAPIFFTTSLHKRWIFGEKGCELYAFCGALFGITSMITLMVIAVDRYFVITRPLASIGVMSRKRAVLILVGVWLYSLSWSLPPFFGWSAYVPEGLLTSCTWDYMTFTPSVRAYTMLLFCFVFFIPLFVIMYCYFYIFKAIKDTNKAVQTIGANDHKSKQKELQKMKKEWKMAKIALIVILLYVVSWSPYSAVALLAFAGYANILTPYVNSVPAVIAKASAIHNPIIYAITHPKYRMAIAKYIPCLGSLLRVTRKDSRSYSSYPSTRRSTVTSQTSDGSRRQRGMSRINSVSDSESTSMDVDDVSMVDVSTVERTPPVTAVKSLNGIGPRKGGSLRRLPAAPIPSIVITSSARYATQPPTEPRSPDRAMNSGSEKDEGDADTNLDTFTQSASIATISFAFGEPLMADIFPEQLFPEELSTIL
ncbi:melanopsin isoform X3 [Ambystoma mexicanum]|uniref:melanopsin isoform X3 n=1 Tax=Ambystoma mexicanum TaxID=8296 RepID=UPI0037E764DF